MYQLNALIIRSRNLILVVLLQILAHSLAVFSYGIRLPCVKGSRRIRLVEPETMLIMPADESRDAERPHAAALSVLLLNACNR